MTAPRPRRTRQFPDPYPDLCKWFRRTPGSLCLSQAEWTSAEAQYRGECRHLFFERPPKRSPKRSSTSSSRECGWPGRKASDSPCRYHAPLTGQLRPAIDAIDLVRTHFQDPNNLLVQLRLTPTDDHVRWHVMRLIPPKPKSRVLGDPGTLTILEVLEYLAARAFVWSVLKGETRRGMGHAVLERQYKYIDVDWSQISKRLQESRTENIYQDAGEHFERAPESLRKMWRSG